MHLLATLATEVATEVAEAAGAVDITSAISSVDSVWTLLATGLVFFMQAGFAMVETGFTRAKNAGNIIMKNLMDFAIGSVVFWIIGFSIMFGDTVGGLIGSVQLLISGDMFHPDNIGLFTFVMSKACSVQRLPPSSAAPWQKEPNSSAIVSILQLSRHSSTR